MLNVMDDDDRQQTPSDENCSHGLWPGELKSQNASFCKIDSNYPENSKGKQKSLAILLKPLTEIMQ